MFGILKKIFGSHQTRLLKKYRLLVEEVNEWERRYQSLTDEELVMKTSEFKKMHEEGVSLDSLLPQAYGVVKNACRRFVGKEVHVFGYDQLWDMVPYDEQIIGGIALHYSAIAEMHTGEGKTLTALFPLYLRALSGKPVHLVTVNDYLAKRDSEWVGQILRFLGITTGSLTNSTPIHERKGVYKKDVVYGTASEFGFDYLRDNSSATTAQEQVQRGHYFALIDEVDSILIDEARTPLIISGPVPQSTHLFHEIKDGVALLIRRQRELCNKLATQVKKTLEQLNFNEDSLFDSFKKSDQQLIQSSCKDLWLVSKGIPTHNLLRRFKELPDIRVQIDQWDLYYSADQNKEERHELLSHLFIIVEEKSSEFELTDKGIQAWISISDLHTGEDFVLHDLSARYIEIDKMDVSHDEKLKLKTQAQQEDQKNKERMHNLRQLLRAHLMMEKDVDYIIQEQKIVIIDENTGRPQPGRRFSDGLHQAIEAKENVAIQQETQTFATITLQNYFRMYVGLAGMTGTASTEASEFKEIYKLDVLAIPTHKPCLRLDKNDEVYMSEREKYKAILKDIQELHAKQVPILVGTDSVETSEKLSRILKQNHIEHTVLNAKNHAQEAEIIAKAGQKSSITIATNMAGRGTDIKLASGVAEIGGLHVLGTTRHNSRRIDRQLRGRCARQGDPGVSKFYISFDDSLMRLFGSPKWTTMLKKLRPPEGEPISAGILNKSIETAQKRVEQRNYTIRKRTLEYDNVLNKQRQEIYSFRNDVMHTEEILDICEDVIESVCLEVVESHLGHSAKKDEISVANLINHLTTLFPVTFTEEECMELSRSDLTQKILSDVVKEFKEKLRFEMKKLPHLSDLEIDKGLQGHLKSILLRRIDRTWQEHLLAMDDLRNDVQMHVVGQKDPLIEFKHEAFKSFDDMTKILREDIVRALFKFEIVLFTQEQIKQVISNLDLENSSKSTTVNH